MKGHQVSVCSIEIISPITTYGNHSLPVAVQATGTSHQLSPICMTGHPVFVRPASRSPGLFPHHDRSHSIRPFSKQITGHYMFPLTVTKTCHQNYSVIIRGHEVSPLLWALHSALAALTCCVLYNPELLGKPLQFSSHHLREVPPTVEGETQYLHHIWFLVGIAVSSPWYWWPG